MRFVLAFLSVLTFSANAQNLKSGGILKPEQAIMDIRHYTISLKVDPATESIDGNTVIDLNLSEPASVLLFDLVHLLTVRNVWVNRKPQPFSQSNDLVKIDLSNTLPVGKVTVKIEYGGKPGVSENPPWVGGFTWATDSLGNPWVAITCQSEGAKIYYPCKDHPSDEPNDGADLHITVPKDLTVAGPGVLISNQSKGAWRTFHWQTKYTINNYSILFNIGKYKMVGRPYKTVSGNTVPMQFYVLENHAHRAASLLDIMERCVRLEEKYFGEYPWVKEKIGICETPHLGMEHQSLNAYGNKFRFTQSGGKNFDWLLLHEFGHEWWGNKVTAKDWADMWIQEGICTFGDHLYTEDHDGHAAYLARMQATARATQNQKPVVQGKDLDTDVVYQSDIYGKGAFFMHSLRYIIGDEVFFPALKALATDPKYTFDNLVVTEDLEKLFSTAWGKDLKPYFDHYLRTTSKLDVSVKQTGLDNYMIKLVNLDMELPMDIKTDKGTQRMMVDKKGIKVVSATVPVVDGDVYYLKRVILE